MAPRADAVRMVLVLACTALGLAATLGATQLVLEAAGEGGGITYYVPLAASILLVSLGSDYSMLLVARVWDHGHVRIDRRVVARATAQSGAAISVAGAVLAASFALLAIVPATGLREFALAMTLGVLIDAFAVRGLLVPALLALLGERSRWPARPRPAPAGAAPAAPPAGG